MIRALHLKQDTPLADTIITTAILNPVYRRRTLLQASQPSCNSSCTLDFKGSTVQFCLCRTLLERAGLRLFWSRVEDGSMEMGLTMNAANEQWMGLGFPSRPGVMVGSNAVIARKASGSNSGMWFGGVGVWRVRGVVWELV